DPEPEWLCRVVGALKEAFVVAERLSGTVLGAVDGVAVEPVFDVHAPRAMPAGWSSAGTAAPRLNEPAIPAAIRVARAMIVIWGLTRVEVGKRLASATYKPR